MELRECVDLMVVVVVVDLKLLHFLVQLLLKALQHIVSVSIVLKATVLTCLTVIL